VRLGIPGSGSSRDGRLAATPETTSKLVARGVEVVVEHGAGDRAGAPDEVFEEAGARLASRAEVLAGSEVVAVVRPLSLDDVGQLGDGSLVVGLLEPHRAVPVVAALADRGTTSLALELLPRISRAQPMDALSSQAGVAGYRAVLLAASDVDKMFPLSMTAAGTVRPASVLVLGAGVAGLQAIATAKRLGATVKANDVRAAAAEEVASLGADFIHIPGVTDQDDASGYARSLGAELAERQHAALLPHLATADVVLCTAAIPGRRAPLLLTAEMVAALPPGALVLDLPADDGGNCALTDPDRTVDHGGVRIVPAPQLARTMPREASALYARNVAAFLGLLVDDDGGLHLDEDDEIVAGSLLTHAGVVRHPPTAELVAAYRSSPTPSDQEDPS
jgi:H+-translocating NAD(P) transhydrogenase subunit alpha